MTAPATRLAADDRARFQECLATTTVSVIHDDIRDARQALQRELGRFVSVDRDPSHLIRAIHDIDHALVNAPDAEVAECPGRLIVTDTGYWHGVYAETARCDVCHREVTS